MCHPAQHPISFSQPPRSAQEHPAYGILTGPDDGKLTRSFELAVRQERDSPCFGRSQLSEPAPTEDAFLPLPGAESELFEPLDEDSELFELADSVVAAESFLSEPFDPLEEPLAAATERELSRLSVR